MQIFDIRVTIGMIWNQGLSSNQEQRTPVEAFETSLTSCNSCMWERPNKARSSVLKSPKCSKLLSIPLFKIISDNKNNRILLDESFLATKYC